MRRRCQNSGAVIRDQLQVRPGTGGLTSTLGTVTLPGDLTQLRVTTVAGTDTFDSPSGKINVVWE